MSGIIHIGNLIRDKVQNILTKSESIIMGMTKLFFMDIRRVIFTAMFVCFIMPAIGQEEDSEKSTKPDPEPYRTRVPGWTVVDSATSKWHPKMFYIELPDLSLSFMLPYEPDQSGVHNLFFISKESGETLLLDTIKDNKRYFTPFSSGSCYDVVLLYNNNTYVKCNDIIFENGIEVDMRNQRIQPSDAVSEHWKKTLRAFDHAIIDRESDRNDRSVSEYVTKGYVFSSVKGKGEALDASIDVGGKRIQTTADGYFEIDNKDDTEQTLSVSSMVHLGIKKSNITASCGLIVVLPVFGKARRVPR